MSDSPSSKPIGPGDHVFLVDGSSFVFRAYFQSINQDAKYNFRSDGLPTGALRLFSTKLYQFVREGAVGIMPTHLAILFDKSEDTFRKEIYPDYKGTRRDPPDDLVPQFPLMREAVSAFGLEPIEKAGFEADDLIATYAIEAEKAGADVLIISSDKDLMQMVTDKVLFYDFESGIKGRSGHRPERKLDIDGVIDYFGVPPDRVTDVQALIGDTSDNVPGVPGIGIKTASALIKEYGDLETLLARAEEIKQPKRRETLINFADQARMSKRLVTLDRHVDCETPLSATRVGDFDAARLIAFGKALELTTLVKRVAEASGLDPNSVEADPRLKSDKLHAATYAAKLMPDEPEPAPSSDDKEPKNAGVAAAATDTGAFKPSGGATAGAVAATAVPIDPKTYETVTEATRLQALIDEAMEAGHVAIAAETTSPDPMLADMVGIALATRPGRAAYIPLGHRNGEADLLDPGLLPGQVPAEEALAALKPLLEDASVLKIAHNLKAMGVVFGRRGVALAPYDDTILLSYALDAGKGAMGLSDLSERWLGHVPIARKEITGTGRAAIAFPAVPIDRATEYVGEQADLALRLWTNLKPRLVPERMTNLYETLERPLVPVLARMEARGITVDRQTLSRLSGEFAQKLGGLEDEIYKLADEQFNIGSPKQLGDILFGKFGLPGGKKTKTGAWSTGADVLDELAAGGIDLAARILDWRQLSKLKSTYTDLLPTFIHAETGRIHTQYALAATSTGRLSSSEPNLQNIPIRTEAGRRIRTAFIADKGSKLISADYSQIELRILAHVADIPELKAAFAEGMDIHAMTASEMFGVPVEGMPREVRNRAKAINFGIIYGISAFGLANQLAIPREEAGAYIKRYFERFPGIRGYMDAMKAHVREHGYVTTLFGRKIHFPQVKSGNPAERAFVDRASINAPIQGTAADVIRRAMIRMEPALDEAGLSAKMLLQVHDELVFEAPEAEVEKTLPVIADVMAKAAEPAIWLTVPLQVDAGAADNWDEAH
ncbi:DNA polymerase I [Bauldia litoralis]|uniref:DNA polymerase I n=1 Tax=Bauldia litoralis TaxID=665467 RepID=A0A1G6DZI0_9HYPH|nr:DNA polymerase I [Bauldia litoralis]SDB50609.1 DNA polymerase I [Bauldia litoralis]